MVGRLVVGLGVGASAIVVPAYLAEIAPAKQRGAIVQMYEVGRVARGDEWKEGEQQQVYRLVMVYWMVS